MTILHVLTVFTLMSSGIEWPNPTDYPIEEEKDEK